jgi:type I restriction enzyme, S subunit
MSDKDLVLPEGWALGKVADITAKVGSGATPRGGKQFYKSSGTPLIRSQNIHFDGFRYDGLVFLDDTQSESLKNAEVQEGDVLLNITGASIGRVTTAPREMDGARVNQHVCIIRLLAGIECKLLGHFLASPPMQDFIMKSNYGVTRQALTKVQIRDFRIPLPPLAEQKRIVAKVETLLASVDKVRTSLDRIPDLLKRLRQSILAAAVSGKLTEDWREENEEIASSMDCVKEHQDVCREQYKFNCIEAKKKGERKPPKSTCLDAHEIAWELEDVFPDKWTICPLGSVCSKITDGTHDTPKTQPEGFPYITAKHIREGIIGFDNCAFLSDKDHRIVYSRCNPEEGDVLMVNIGAGTATPALVNVDYEFSMKNVALLKPLSGLLNGHYLEYNQRFMKDSIFKNITRGGAQPFLGLNLIKTLPIILPPYNEQEEIIRRVGQVFQLADKLEARYRKTKQAVDKLTQSILAKALRGELVRTEAELARQEGRPYETADALLVRIKAEQDSKPAKSKRIKKATNTNNRRLLRASQ